MLPEDVLEYRIVWNGKDWIPVKMSDWRELLEHADRCSALLELEMDAPLHESAAPPLDEAVFSR